MKILAINFLDNFSGCIFCTSPQEGGSSSCQSHFVFSRKFCGGLEFSTGGGGIIVTVHIDCNDISKHSTPFQSAPPWLLTVLGHLSLDVELSTIILFSRKQRNVNIIGNYGKHFDAGADIQATKLLSLVLNNRGRYTKGGPNCFVLLLALLYFIFASVAE